MATIQKIVADVYSPDGTVVAEWLLTVSILKARNRSMRRAGCNSGTIGGVENICDE